MPEATATPKAELTPESQRQAADLDAVAEELKERLAPRIQLVEKLGEGGMGVVFLGRDPMLHRSVAIKVLSPALASDPHAQERFAREAQSAAAIPHPNIVSIYEVGDLPRSGLSYFVMQHIEGDSLYQLHSAQTLQEPAIRRIVGEIASALAAAHARGVIHRDIKPANIMIERASGRAIVLDFGIAAVLENQPGTPGADVTSTGGIGTPSHISPEQVVGKHVTDKTDVYSLGVVAFELATGRYPFMEVTPIGMIHAHLKQKPPRVHELRPELDQRLAALIDRCLSKKPEERPTAAEVARYLRPGLETAIEWPPPGLGHVRETGRKLFSSLRALTLCVVTFFLAVYAQPRLATVSWRQGESSTFWRAVWAPYNTLQSASRLPPPDSPDATPLWFSLVVASGIASVIAAGILVRRALRLAKESRVSHQGGYPWSAIAAVAADAGPDTADLVNGLGKYSALDSAKRDKLLRLRRLETYAVVLAALATFALPLIWLRVAGAMTTQWLTGVEMLLLATPLFLLVIAFLLRVPERQARRRGPAVVRGRRGSLTPHVARGLVDGWLKAATEIRGLPRPVPRWSLLQLPIVVVAGVLTIVVVATIGISAFAIWSSPMLRDWVDAWREGRRAVAVATPPVRWATIDSQIARLVIPRSEATRDLQLKIASGRRAWRSTDVATYIDGTRMLREALYALMTFGRLRGDLQLAQRARSVYDAVETYQSSNAIIARGWAPLVLADPRDTTGIAEIRDRGNAPAVRRELIRGVVDGYCYNGRERLFGVSPLRRFLLQNAARAARDLPAADDLVARERKRLTDLLALGGVGGIRARSRRCG